MRLAWLAALVGLVVVTAAVVPPRVHASTTFRSQAFALNGTGGSRHLARIFRDSVASTCANPKNPALVQTLDPSTNFDYRSTPFESFIREPACVTVAIDTACTGTDAIMSTTYSPEFDPANITSGYVADLGDSPPNKTQYSFTVPPGGQFETVVDEINTAGECGAGTVTWTSDRPFARLRPPVLGTPAVGQTLETLDNPWPENPLITRQWVRCDPAGANCTAIPGAIGTTYTVTDADVGHTLTMRESAKKDGFTSTLDYEGTPVAFTPFATFTGQSLGAGDGTDIGRPTVTEVPSTCDSPKQSDGGIRGSDPFPRDVFTATSLINEPACVFVGRSLGDCSSTVQVVYSPAFVPGAITDNYVADGAITNELSYTLGPGQTSQAVVFQLDVGFGCDDYDLFLGSITPFATASPALSGAAVQGQPIGTSDGAWGGSPTFAHAWLRCDQNGAGCDPIGGATGSSYTPVAADVGHRLRARVTATQHGSASADSAPSEVVAADTTAPELVAASLTNKVFAVNRRGATEVSPAARRKRPKKGTTFRYQLSENAVVTFSVRRARPGRRVGRKCVKPTRRNRGKRKCTRFVRAGRFQVTSTAGSNRHRFSGRINRKALRPGRYRVLLRATDGASNVSAARRLKFRIVRLRAAS